VVMRVTLEITEILETFATFARIKNPETVNPTQGFLRILVTPEIAEILEKFATLARIENPETVNPTQGFSRILVTRFVMTALGMMINTNEMRENAWFVLLQTHDSLHYNLEHKMIGSKASSSPTKVESM
jgi:hypothetical protein